MSESDPNSEEFPFDYRTTNDRFQEKLREAQEQQANRQILDDLEQTVFDSNEEDLETQRAQLLAEVEKAEEEVQSLKSKLAQRKSKREYQAGIFKLTPKERADAMEVDDEKEDEVNMDVIFDYLIRIGSAPMPSNAADMSKSNFVMSHAELRDKAMQSPEVMTQSEFAHIHFTKTNNRVNESDESGTIRYCELEGMAYDQEFSVAFEILEPGLLIRNMTLKVSVDFEIDAGPLLEKIKEESNILAFFRLLLHYGKLDSLRKTTFKLLESIYSSRNVSVEQALFDTLKFTNSEQNELVLTLTWQNRSTSIEPVRSLINICEKIMPDIRMEASGLVNDDKNLAQRLAPNFESLLNLKGALLACQIIVNAAFQPKEL